MQDTKTCKIQLNETIIPFTSVYKLRPSVCLSPSVRGDWTKMEQIMNNLYNKI